MRFGKRPRSTRLFGRKSTPPAESATPESAAYEPMQHEEWNALVTPDEIDAEWQTDNGQESASFALDNAGEDESMSADTGREAALDPTNRLLTALGRFHREVLKAREGSAHGEWPDVCMNQLINAVEIALDQGWTEVVEALGESGRVLQSYSEAGRAHDSVVFLEDAYELLCLMVGDLIVGSVRPGVIQKWRERYARAIEDLEAAGLTLVNDDDGLGHEHAGAAPFANAGMAPEASPEVPFESMPALDALAPLEDEMPGTDAVDDDSETDGAPPLLDTVSEALALIETDPHSKHPAAFATIADAVESLEQMARAEGRHSAAFAGEVMRRLCDGAQQTAAPLDDRFFELAYGFPGLYAEANDSPGDDSVDAWSMECETILLGWSDLPEPEEPAEESPAAAIIPDDAMPEDAPFESTALDDASHVEVDQDVREVSHRGSDDGGLPDLGAIIEAIEEEAAAVQSAPAEESPGMMETVDESAAEIPVVEVGSIDDDAAVRQALDDIIEAESSEALEDALEEVMEAAAPLEEVIDTPMQILKVAEQAVSEGRAVNAKLLLLQAAASIAESETAEAHRLLEQATKRIQQEAEAIEAAMAAVSTAETQVAEAESAVAAGAEEIEARRTQVEEHGERVNEVQARIEAIDEEIRALQARREEEAAQLEQAQAELAETAEQTANLEGDVNRRQEAEAAARQQLEEARAQVKHHQRRRQEFEGALDQANEEVRQRSESLAELQQTMQRFNLPRDTGEHESGDLFGQDASE
jgi:hypothetical protein